MPLSRERFLLDRRRIRLVLDYLEQNLDEDGMSLGRLAEVASLSRYHFERMYVARVGEAPMATLRRLRLARAHRSLLEGRVRSITDLAMQSGYGSVAAFSRAFSRTFMRPPSGILPTPLTPPRLDVVQLPSWPIWRLPYSGRAADVFAAGEEFSWLLARGGAQQWRHWTVHPHGWIDPVHHPDTWVGMWHCVPQTGQPPRFPGLERGWLPGGTYARIPMFGSAPRDFAELEARIAAETGWRLADGPVVRHFPQIAHHRPPSERCVLFHLPVVPDQISNPDQNSPDGLT